MTIGADHMVNVMMMQKLELCVSVTADIPVLLVMYRSVYNSDTIDLPVC